MAARRHPLVRSGGLPALPVEPRAVEALRGHMGCDQPRLGCGVRGPDRYSARRAPAPVPAAACRHNCAPGTAGSRTPPAVVDVDPAVSGLGAIRIEQPIAHQSVELDAALGADCRTALPSPQRSLAQVLVGHRRVWSGRLVCGYVGRSRCSAFIGYVLADLRGPAPAQCPSTTVTSRRSRGCRAACPHSLWSCFRLPVSTD